MSTASINKTVYTISTGGRGPTGSDAEVTTDNVAAAGALMTSGGTVDGNLRVGIGYQLTVDSVQVWNGTSFFYGAGGAAAHRAALDAVADNDTRLTDARTPTAHKSTHATGGADLLLPSDIGAMEDTNAAVNAAIAEDAAASRAAMQAEPTTHRTSIPAYRAAIAAGAVPSILAIGDSMIGYRYNVIAQAIHRKFGFAGWTFLDTFAQNGTTKTNIDTARWITGETYSIPVDGRMLMAKNSVHAVVGDTLLVYYVIEPGAGTFKVQTNRNGAGWVDDPTHTNVNCDGTLAGGVIEILKPWNSADIETNWMVRVVGLTGTCTGIGGGIFHSLRGGARIAMLYNGSAEGNNLNDAVNTPRAITDPILAKMAPNLIILSHLDGAAVVNADQAQYQDNITDSVVSGGAATPSWICVGPPPNGNPTFDIQNVAQTAAMRSLAETRGDGWFDNRQWALPVATLAARGLMTDGTHYTTLAYRQWIEELLSVFAVTETTTTTGSQVFAPVGGGSIRRRYGSTNSLLVEGTMFFDGEVAFQDATGPASHNDFASISLNGNTFQLRNTGNATFLRVSNGIGGGYTIYDSSATASVPKGSLGGTTVPIRDLNLGKHIVATGTTTAPNSTTRTSGRANFAATETSKVVTASLCTANSIVLVTLATNDATAKSAKVVAGAGSFTIYLDAAADAETAVNWFFIP